MNRLRLVAAGLLLACSALPPTSALAAKPEVTIGNSCGVLNNVYCHYIPWVYVR
jgi:ABC-type sugar transport system substrate-binding protein